VADLAMMEAAARRARALLLAGAAIGAALAAWGLVRGQGGSAALPADLVARVNGIGVRRADYERMLVALAEDRRSPLDEADKRHVLDRLIEEELLVQKGLELDLPRNDRRVRADLTSSVIASVVQESESREPTEQQLREFYERNRDFFAHPGRLRVREIFCRAADGSDAERALGRANEAVRRLRAGESFADVAAAVGDQPIVALPDALLPPAKLQEYIGPTVLRTALQLDRGAVSDPVRSTGGYYVLQVTERQADDLPPFEQIKDQVREEYRRRTGSDALRSYLDSLRGAAKVEISESLP
jgi:parvulin-like peptidyl-prolyl isomerase